MGFYDAGLGPSDQKTILLLERAIISTLRKASGEIATGRGCSESLTWFGDNSRLWMEDLARKLNKMASLINLSKIDVFFAALSEREEAFAAAYEPAGGFFDFTSARDMVSRSNTIRFQLELNHSWNTTPTYRTSMHPEDSKFQTLVHECSHLFLHTNDHDYGVADCRYLALSDPPLAKNNADSWGYFVEEFR